MRMRMENKMNNKKGTHSTQKKYFNTIPRSEFYGFVVGYALGLIICGALRIESQIPQLVIAVIGFGIGYFIDKKYFQEPDEPEVPAGGAASADTSKESAPEE